MSSIIKQAVNKRTDLLFKRRGNHEHFIRSLLAFETIFDDGLAAGQKARTQQAASDLGHEGRPQNSIPESLSSSWECKTRITVPQLAALSVIPVLVFCRAAGAGMRLSAHEGEHGPSASFQAR